MKRIRKSKRVILALLMIMLLLSLPTEARAGSSAALPEDEMRELTEMVGEEYGICPELLQAIAWRESSYQPSAENGTCIGLMQVDQRWHNDRMEKLGVTDLHDPDGNMWVAADYLAELFAEYEEADVVLMFYSGNSRAEEYSRGNGEMSKYVRQVLEASEKLEREHGK